MNRELWREVDDILGEALDLPPEAQRPFVESRCTGKPELLAEVLGILEAHAESADFLPAPTFNPSASAPIAAQDLRGRRIGAYLITDEIGRGGMGAVYRARRADSQFELEVAIKVLEPGRQNRQSLRHFESERQVLATLDHPNITRLLDSGVTDDGIPFIVMEFVSGERIESYCDAQKLDLPARLRLFQSVCDAVQFAHQRLVVHRDIKGENILVTPAGAPKLLDFGIAKILEQAATGQTAHWQPMTLDSASPEQLRGQTVTTATDVYSLGVLLYKLAAGRPPYHLAGLPLTEVVQTVCEQPPAPLNVSDDLDAIVAKALRKEPAERYSTVAELAADIERYLTQLPVLAHRGNFQYLAGKFLRRNRRWVAAAALALFLIAAGIAAIVREARIANLERAAAQRRFDDVRRLARSVLFEFHDGVVSLPGSTKVRQLMVTRALEYLDRLASESGQDQELALELAGGYERVGRVQGDPNLANLGDFASAIANMEKACKILEKVIAANQPKTKDRARVGMAGLLETMSSLRLSRGDLDNAVKGARQALQIRQALLAESPQNPDRQRGVANAHFAVATSLMVAKAPGARQEAEKMVQVFEDLLTADPANGDRQRSAALAHKSFGGWLLSYDDGPATLPHLQRALELDEKRLTAEPNHSVIPMDVAIDLGQLAAYLSRAGNKNEALSYAVRSTELRRKLLAAEPKDARMQNRLVFALNLEAFLRSHVGQKPAAKLLYTEAYRIASALVAADPARPDGQRNLLETASALFVLGGPCDLVPAARSAVKALQARKFINKYDQEHIDTLETALRQRTCPGL